jgi:hypothetical protein
MSDADSYTKNSTLRHCGRKMSGSSVPCSRAFWRFAAFVKQAASDDESGFARESNGDGSMSPTNNFAPASTPAESIFGLSIFVLLTVAAILVVVLARLAYVVIRFRSRRTDDASEPAQIYGSTQVEMAWTVIPILIVVNPVAHPLSYS